MAAGIVLLGGAVTAAIGLRGATLAPSAFLHWAEAIAATGTAGWIGFAALQVVVSVSGLLPASALGIAAGSIYGIGVGFTLSAASSLAGAALAFALSRSVFRPWIERRMLDRQRLRQVDAAIRRDGWRLACLVRLSPVMPFAATSYMLGLSSISFRDYCIGTLGSLPALFGYVAIGALAGASVHASTSGAGLIRLGMLAVGLVATVIVTLRIGKLVASATGWSSPPVGSADSDTAETSRSISPVLRTGS
jgi:uncharacterized membrane protein YdjX (TVP38/TMEM64 family)